MTKTDRRIHAGDLVSHIYNAGGHGTCLAYSQVIAYTPGQITVKAPADCVTADPDGMLRMSDHPDFVELKPLNDTCVSCGDAVHTVTFRPDTMTSYDIEGSHRCLDGGEHLGAYWAPPCQEVSHAKPLRVVEDVVEDLDLGPELTAALRNALADLHGVRDGLAAQDADQ